MSAVFLTWINQDVTDRGSPDWPDGPIAIKSLEQINAGDDDIEVRIVYEELTDGRIW